MWRGWKPSSMDEMSMVYTRRRVLVALRPGRRSLILGSLWAGLLIALAATQVFFRSPTSRGVASSPSFPRTSFASSPSSDAMATLSLPERLSMAYHDYMNDMRESQAIVEQNGEWRMPLECKEMIEAMDSRKTFYSELGQDLFLYKHFFRNGQDADGRRRFFLDIGANSPRDNSNTLFFEKCLGWEGICVEANPDLAAKFVGQRKCKVENVCISNKASTLTFLKAGYMGHVVDQDSGVTNGVDGADTVKIPCITITQLLAKHNVTHVDMLSIDIEAEEYAALSPLLEPEARDIKIDVVAAEVFWSDVQLRWLMSDLGFWKVTDIAHVDDIFVRMQFMDHTMADARQHYYQMMKNKQRERNRPIIAPW